MMGETSLPLRAMRALCMVEHSSTALSMGTDLDSLKKSALDHGVCVSLESGPVLYRTGFIKFLGGGGEFGSRSTEDESVIFFLKSLLCALTNA
ncbi:hypothetical protein HMPREF2743_00275 [Corynebacterium sp. HMSC036D02]|nr:hypothetical protein HMPREF2743_00275 [Corynebacterium sp. HMSC036D02]